MNRLQHFLRAKTQYSLHSPFVYKLYTEVLFSRAPEAPHGRFEQTIWRLEQHYGVKARRHGDIAKLDAKDIFFMVINHPHRNEKSWNEVIEEPFYQVTLDFYSVGIAISNPRLSRQHFILR
jgi:hypothetical protein